MDKTVAAIEFGSKKMKLVVGYELDGQVYVLYTLAKPYGAAIEGGEIVNDLAISKCVNETKEFSDSSARLKLSISDALLAIPPYGLEVFQNKQVTTVISEENKIGNLEIKNIYALIRNTGIPVSDNVLVDVVPERFALDQGRIFSRPPLGETSSTLTVYAKVQTLPSHYINTYQNALINGGMSVKRFVISSLAATELIASYPDLPLDYLLVDIGSNMTTVSLVGQKALYGSKYFEWGGDNITEKIVEAFNINESDAEKYKITYGIDNRVMNFKAPVCVTEDAEGNEIKHYNDELNTIIKTELEEFVKLLNQTIDELLKNYNQSYKNLPMLLIGGGSQLNGLVNYISPKVMSETVTVVLPRSLGARNPTFTNCLGMILTHAKYMNINDEAHPKVGQVTRNSLTK